MSGLQALDAAKAYIIGRVRLPAFLARVFGQPDAAAARDFAVVDHIYAGASVAEDAQSLDTQSLPKFLLHESIAGADSQPPPLLRGVHRPFMLTDVSLLLAAVLTAGVWLRVAENFDPHEARNTAADALAERFANPAPSRADTAVRDSKDEPGVPVPAFAAALDHANGNAEARLNFAPGLSIENAGQLRTGPETNPDAAAETASAETARDFEVQGLASNYQSLSVLIVRNLPPGASFSAGARSGNGAWALAEADLDTLVLTLPAGADKSFKAEIETIAADGNPAGTMTVELRSEDKPAAAMKRPAVVAEADVKPAKPKKVHKKIVKKVETAHVQQKRLIKQSQQAYSAKAQPQAQSADAGDAAPPKKSPGILTQIFTKLGLIPAEPSAAALAGEEK